MNFEEHNTSLSEVYSPLPTIVNRIASNQPEYSPLLFPACPRGRGRPKLAKCQGVPLKKQAKRKKPEADCFNFIDEISMLAPYRTNSSAEPPKKRGRPKGPKTKKLTYPRIPPTI